MDNIILLDICRWASGVIKRLMWMLGIIGATLGLIEEGCMVRVRNCITKIYSFLEVYLFIFFTLCSRQSKIIFVTISDEYGRGMRMDLRGEGNKRRPPRNEPEQSAKETPPSTQTAPAAAPRPEVEVDDKPIPDDLSEISDDPDDILNREDVSIISFVVSQSVFYI